MNDRLEGVEPELLSGTANTSLPGSQDNRRLARSSVPPTRTLVKSRARASWGPSQHPSGKRQRARTGNSCYLLKGRKAGELDPNSFLSWVPQAPTQYQNPVTTARVRDGREPARVLSAAEKKMVAADLSVCSSSEGELHEGK